MHVPQRVIRPQRLSTECLAEARIPTRHGEFETHVFRSAVSGTKAAGEVRSSWNAAVPGSARFANTRGNTANARHNA